METQSAPYGSLAQSARSSELKKAKGILWFVGILTILVNGFMFFTAETQIDNEIDREMKKHGGSLAAVRDLPEAQRSLFDSERTKAINQAKLGLGGGVVLGILFIGCALMVNRKPVAATVTGLVLYLGATAVFAAMEPESMARGLIIKIFIIIGLVSSVKAALAVEKQARSTEYA